MKNKIVITGISSAIMKELAEEINLSKYQVVGITRHLSNVYIKNVKFIEGNLLDIIDYSDILKDCYMVIHGAALTHTRKEKEYFKINLGVTKRLVDATRKHKVERFVFISSNTAGKTSGTYGLTKLLAEQYIQQQLHHWIIFRISEVYGGHKSEGLEKLIHDVLNNTIVLCPMDIPSKLCPIHIKDVVRQIFQYTFLKEKLNTTLIINGPQAFSYLEIIKLIQNISKRKNKVIYLSKKMMFFIKWILKKTPFQIGIVPDQVDRLYSIKNIEPNENSLINMNEYIQELVCKKINTLKTRTID